MTSHNFIDWKRKSNFHSLNKSSLTISLNKKAAIKAPKLCQQSIALANQVKSTKVESGLKSSHSEVIQVLASPKLRRFNQVSPFNGCKKRLTLKQSNSLSNRNTNGIRPSSNARSNNFRITLSESKRVIHDTRNNRIEHDVSNVADGMDCNSPEKQVQVLQAFAHLLNRKICSIISEDPSKERPTEQQMQPLNCIVIDTNILLTSLMFVEHLLEKNEKVPGRPTIIIPYVVLQELDKLKIQSDQSVSQSASLAIKFIHKHLKNRESKICGQTAMAHKKTLINVDNSDDYILNCCLQLKQIHSHIAVLSNDVNFRNKALCSNIEAFSYDELNTILCLNCYSCNI